MSNFSLLISKSTVSICTFGIESKKNEFLMLILFDNFYSKLSYFVNSLWPFFSSKLHWKIKLLVFNVDRNATKENFDEFTLWTALAQLLPTAIVFRQRCLQNKLQQICLSEDTKDDHKFKVCPKWSQNSPKIAGKKHYNVNTIQGPRYNWTKYSLKFHFWNYKVTGAPATLRSRAGWV